jgi:hypothetical protein
MSAHYQVLADFRSQVTKLLQERDVQWEASRRMVEAARLQSTLMRLLDAARRGDVAVPVRDAIEVALNSGTATSLRDLPAPRLKELTGLPPTKAVRALCVWFDVVDSTESRWPLPSLKSNMIADFMRQHANPFDLLLESDVASLLDLGAGDLSFAVEVADQYVPVLQSRGRSLTLHCLDRLHPNSKLGGPLHAEHRHLQDLRTRAGLSFQFLGNQDMFAMDDLVRTGRLASCYEMVTCWAPASPTFAYEPTRLSAKVIATELQRMKGVSRQVRYEGEAALEVQHGHRTLLFPPWKFEIRGPLALLNTMSRRGLLCVLGAVEAQIFYELLAQLLDDERYRPRDIPFTSETIPEVFGEIHHRLSRLEIGQSVNLADLGTVRTKLPSAMRTQPDHSESYGFGAIQIRRGAVFPGLPTSSTARRFPAMVEESPPWFLCLIPHRA